MTAVVSCSPDYEASLKKEGGIPEGPVLESLLAGETLDKKVETKEEEPMSECQVSLFLFVHHIQSSPSFLLLFFFPILGCPSLFICLLPPLCLCLRVCASAFVSLSLRVCALAVAQAPAALTTPSWHRACVCACDCA